MEINCRKGRIESEAAELIAVSHFEGETRLLEDSAQVDRGLGGMIKQALSCGEFSGKLGQTLLLHTDGKIPAARVMVIGLGKRGELTADQIRRAIAPAARAVRELGVKRFASIVHGRDVSGIKPRVAADAVVEGALLGLYRFQTFRTENRDEIKDVEGITLLERSGRKLAESKTGAREGQILAEAANFARDLSNTPANEMTPTEFARHATHTAEEFGMDIEVLNRADAQRLGMGAFLSVAQGSQEPPKFIVMEYRRGRRKTAPIVLVGKTITFDSGGISIKPSLNMHLMKHDMSGGAAVLGTMQAIARLQLPVSVVAILPATENLPSGRATKPGDVVRSFSGKTIEILNTDAEGRLILADGLAYAERFKPAAVIDIATLTGACVVALGHHASAAVTNNPRLLERVRKAGELTGERIWELPLWDEYREQIKSDVADVQNIGGPAAGTITAAAFLNRFVGPHPWVHLDIAGTAWTEQPRPYAPKGATGVGVRLLTRILADWS